MFADILRSAAARKPRNVCGIPCKEECRCSFVCLCSCTSWLLILSSSSSPPPPPPPPPHLPPSAPASTPVPLSVASDLYLPNAARTQRTIITSVDRYPCWPIKKEPEPLTRSSLLLPPFLPIIPPLPSFPLPHLFSTSPIGKKAANLERSRRRRKLRRGRTIEICLPSLPLSLRPSLPLV